MKLSTRSTTSTMAVRPALALFVAVLFALSPFQNFALAADTSPAQGDEKTNAPADTTTTLKDQTDLTVTVYNSDLALVRDVRQLTLPTGTFRLQFEDGEATINPGT